MFASDVDTEVVKPLTHAERRAIIEAPFLCRVIGGYSWGGTGTSDWTRENKQRAYACNGRDWQWHRTQSAHDTFGG
jgi:hypothetical protein